MTRTNTWCILCSFITSKKLVIYNGIDSRYIIDDSDKIPHDGINILISGRISKDKGQWQAIEACKNLLKENSQTNIKIYQEKVKKSCNTEAKRKKIMLIVW